jgi:hypothetical protein
LRAHDSARVARLIARSPGTAERYLEEELLPQWAEAPSQERLDAARMLAPNAT